MEPVCDAYHSWYYDREVWQTTTFLGIRTLKSVSDMWNYQEILTELKPSVVVEFGTFRGGATLYFAEMLKLISSDYRVLSVDINHGPVDERVRHHDRIELLESSTDRPHVAARIAELRQMLPGKLFCILDSNHRRDHVFAELCLLRPVTVPGDYVVVEDGNINGHPVLPGWGPGPYEAIEEYRGRFPDDYTHDAAREAKFGFTFAPGGFLVRR